MPTGQQLVDLLAQSGAITLANTPVGRPVFNVNYNLLRALLAPEQSVMTTGAAPIRMRRDTGDMSLMPPGGGNPVTIPTIILLGADGSSGGAGGLRQDGETVFLNEPQTDGNILIAAGGNGAGPPQARAAKEDSDAGDATVVGGNENLIIALGGNGSSPVGATGQNGGDGGDANAIGVGSGNDLYVQGGDGGIGSPGSAGTPGVSGVIFLVTAVPGGNGGNGGDGGDGGKAFVSGSESSFGESIGGNGGRGGAGGTPGAGAAGGFLGIAAPGGALGGGGAGGAGGNIKNNLGPNSFFSLRTAPGVGRPGGLGAGGLGAPGTPGIIEI